MNHGGGTRRGEPLKNSKLVAYLKVCDGTWGWFVRGRCLPSSRGPICIAAFKIVSCRTLRWWCDPQAGPNARHHNYSQILRVFPKNLLTIPAVLCDNRIIEQLPNRKSLCKTRNQHDASPTYFRETLHPVWYPTPPKLNEWPHIPGKIVGAKHSFYWNKEKQRYGK